VNTLRPDDLLGRWGGEEFVALLTDVTEEQAVQAAERLRLAISKRGFKLSDGTRLQVSVSIGLMAMQAADYDPRTQLRKLVAVADVALYEAKRGGRDQVRVGEPQTRPMPLGDALVSPWVSGVGARSTH
jgi:diguanylate cyclase (GGDEF)-like protein